VGRPLEGQTLVIYDGLCGLCDRFVRFLLTRDSAARLRFAPLQSPLAEELLRRHGWDAGQETIRVVSGWGTSDERILERSSAVLDALRQLGPWWDRLSRAASVLPTAPADRLYAVIARHRYRVFGRLDTCPLPRPEWRVRFVDRPEGERPA
jgi:predicted DCC family thiol-disulfide oxidoreductase YuxK